jgi:hypothetical protein
MSDDPHHLGPPKTPGVMARFFKLLKARLSRAYSRHRSRYRAKNRAGYRVFARLAVSATILLLAAACVWIGRPLYRHIKERRAARLAETFLEKGDPRNAALRAQQTLQLNPNNLTANRVMARLTGQAHSPAELLWQRRVTGLEPTIDNKLLLAETGLRCQSPPFPVTAQVFAELGDTATNNARYQNIAAQLSLAQHDLVEADTHFIMAARLDPTNAHYILNLALWRLAQTNEAQRAESRLRLQQLRTDPIYGPAALRGLIKDRLQEKDLATADAYSTELLASPQATLPDQLQNLSILRLQKSATLPARLQVIQQQAQTNATTAAALANWMLANGFAENVLKWLATLPDQIQSQPPLLLAQAEAYQHTGDWQGLRDFASQGNWGDFEYLRFATLAHADAQAGRTYAAQSNWDLAVHDKTVNGPGALEKLLELAARWQLKSEIPELLERMVQDFPGQRDGVQALALLYTEAGNTVALNQLYTRLNRLFPEDVSYQVNWAATSLLLQTNLPQAMSWAVEAHARTLGDPQLAVLAAYALHLEHHDAEGITLLEKLPPDRLALPTPTLYYGVLLAAAGRSGEAAIRLQSVRTNASWLLPEEKQLLSTALGGK